MLCYMNTDKLKYCDCLTTNEKTYMGDTNGTKK